MRLVLHVLQCAILLLVVTVQSHGVGGGAAPAGTDTALILYAYHEGSANGTSLLNLRYFLKVGVLEDPRYMFAFVVNGCHSVDFPTHLPNVLVIERPNLCFDMGAWNEGVETVHHHLGYHADKKLFDRYVFINGSVRGPFLPVWAGNLGLDWVQIFTAQLNDNVKLVGTTFNCMGDIRLAHLQSMAFATDRLGLEVLLPVLRHCPAIPKVLQGGFPPEEVAAATTAAEKWTMRQIIQYGELLYSQDILAAGYSIATIMLNYAEVTGDGVLNYENWPQVQKVCERMTTEVTKACTTTLSGTTTSTSSSSQGSSNYNYCDDPYQDEQCRLSHAYSPHPLELIFFKTNRNLLIGAMQFYTQSALNRAGGLGDREYLLTKPMSAGVGCPSPIMEPPSCELEEPHG